MTYNLVEIQKRQESTDKFVQKVGKTLWHYTSFPALDGILRKKEIWFGSATNVNDAKEVIGFIDNLKQNIENGLTQNNIKPNNIVFLRRDIIGYSQSELIAKAIDVDMYIRLQDAIFEPLPGDIQAKLRTLVTNYPVTNISVTSDQLDGYTVFNYPISMANGWNYAKKQLNDNRDYIYDMDIQSAEAYVNSEYAVALTELEV